VVGTCFGIKAPQFLDDCFFWRNHAFSEEQKIEKLAFAASQIYFRCFCGQNEIRNVQFDVAKAHILSMIILPLRLPKARTLAINTSGTKQKKFIAKPFKVDLSFAI